jgi:excisionase family DNA binding protein
MAKEAARKKKSMIPVKSRIVADRRVTPDRREGRSTLSVVKRVLTTREACRYLRVSRPTFLKMIADGKIKAQKVGRGWKVLESELERFLVTG